MNYNEARCDVLHKTWESFLVCWKLHKCWFK